MTVKRLDILLCGVLLLELVSGAFLFLRRETFPRPPQPKLARSHALRGDFEDLATHCKTLDDWHNLAEVYTAYGFYVEAEACYKFLISQRTRDPQLLLELGFLLSQMGRTSDANSQLAAALDAGHPAPADCWYLIGRNHLR